MTPEKKWVVSAEDWSSDPDEDALWNSSRWFRKPGDFAQINAAFDAGEEDPPPAFGVRDDGQALFYSGEVNNIFGTHSSAKSWIALYTVKQAVEAGEKVLYFDFEDSPRKAGYRLRIIGTQPRCIEANLMHVRPHGPFTPYERDMLKELVRIHQFGLVVIDTVGVAIGAHGGDSNKDSDVASWLDQFPNAVASWGPCVLLVDHTAMSMDDANKPGGSGRKMQSVNGASYFVKRTNVYGIGRTGTSQLICKKDRNGVYSINDEVATFSLVSQDKWTAKAHLAAPSPLIDPIAAGVRILDACNADLNISRDEARQILANAGWKGRNDKIMQVIQTRKDQNP